MNEVNKLHAFRRPVGEGDPRSGGVGCDIPFILGGTLMKRIFIILCLAVLGIFVLCSCGGKKKSKRDSLEDGQYNVEVELKGGSGRAYVSSPALVSVENGVIYVYIEMSSKNYDYMIVDSQKYLPVNSEGNSMFKIMVPSLDSVEIIADTTAMGTPHEIEYTLEFDSSTVSVVE